MRRTEMLGGVRVLRRIAAADVPALEARSQVHPAVPSFEAFFAAIGTGMGREVNLI